MNNENGETNPHIFMYIPIIFPRCKALLQKSEIFFPDFYSYTGFLENYRTFTVLEIWRDI